MKVPRPKPPIDTDQARRLHLEEGLTIADVARRLGFTSKSVSNALRRAGTRIRHERAMVATERGRRLHITWRSILARCTLPNDPLYERYGARGVTVCDEWLEFAAFRQWALANGWKPGLSLGLDVQELGYSPGNCAWISRSENIARGIIDGPKGSRWGITAFGETKSALAWADDPRCAVGGQGLLDRLARGMSPEEAIRAPLFSVRGTQLQPPKRKRRRKEYAPIDWDRAHELHVEKGLDVAEVALLLDASYHGVLRGLRLRGWLVLKRDGSWRTLPHARLLRKAWQSMGERCRHRSHPDFERVGGKGIRVCDAWQDFKPFHAWAMRSGYRPGLCLARSDRRGNYEPGNCAWVTRAELLRSSKRKVSRKPRWTVTAFGKTKGPNAWSRDRRCAVSLSGLLIRLRGGWKPEDAITTPSRTGPKEPVIWVTAFGETKGVEDWVRDRRCRVGATSLRKRLDRGWSAEKAISTPAFEGGPGVRRRRT